MRRIFNELYLRRFNLLFLPIAVVWSMMNTGSVLLSQKGIEQFSDTFDPFFEMIRFGDKFLLTNEAGPLIKGKTITTTILVPSPHRIKAIYRSDSSAFASISDGQATTPVALGGTYKKVYTLIGLNDDSAVFKGYGKSYRLRLGHDDPLSFEQSVTRSVADVSQSKNEWRTIPRDVVMQQSKDLRAIYKQIEISEIYKGNKIDGFRVNSIDPNSIFGRLGLVSGDVILAVNNQKLESYADAISIYNKVPRMRSIQITVLRNNLPKDIVYEITR